MKTCCAESRAKMERGFSVKGIVIFHIANELPASQLVSPS